TTNQAGIVEYPALLEQQWVTVRADSFAQTAKRLDYTDGSFKEGHEITIQVRPIAGATIIFQDSDGNPLESSEVSASVSYFSSGRSGRVIAPPGQSGI